MKDQTFGELVRTSRKQRGLTLVELAQKVAVSQPFLTDIERGRRYPSDEVLHKIAATLGIDSGLLRTRNTPAALRYFRDLLQRDHDLSLAFTEMIKMVQDRKISLQTVTKRLTGAR